MIQLVAILGTLGAVLVYDLVRRIRRANRRIDQLTSGPYQLTRYQGGEGK